MARQFQETSITDEGPRHDFATGTDVIRIPNGSGGRGVGAIADLFRQNRDLKAVFGEDDRARQSRYPGADDGHAAFHFGGCRTSREWDFTAI